MGSGATRTRLFQRCPQCVWRIREKQPKRQQAGWRSRSHNACNLARGDCCFRRRHHHRRNRALGRPQGCPQGTINPEKYPHFGLGSQGLRSREPIFLYILKLLRPNLIGTTQQCIHNGSQDYFLVQ